MTGGVVKRVNVSVVVRGEASDQDDEGVAGTYRLEVDVGDAVKGEPLTAAQLEAVHEEALDRFHEKVGIACLDDFEISATCEAGEEVEVVGEAAGSDAWPAVTSRYLGKD